MKTDKEIYKIFTAYPKYLFHCANIRNRTSYTMESVTLKEFERRTDGILKPKNPKEPTYVMEFQAQTESNIYHRLIMEMALFAMTHPDCKVRGILIFLDKDMDPKTNPWHSLSKTRNKFLRIVYMKDYIKDLEKHQPKHPLVAVFKPLFEKDLDKLRSHSRIWYQQITKSRLPKAAKENFQKAFTNWLLVRFPKLNYEEVIQMIETLPDLEETLAYKQLVGIGKKLGEKSGEKRGEKRGIKITLIGQQKFMLKEIKRFETMNKKGEIDDVVCNKLCAPIRKELKKVKDQIDTMIKELSSQKK